MSVTLVLEHSKSSLFDILTWLIVVNLHQHIVLYNDRSHHSPAEPILISHRHKLFPGFSNHWSIYLQIFLKIDLFI